MKWLINALTKLGLLNEDLDYHLIRGSMVVLFLFFGYQKWFEYEAQVLIPYISNGPLIFWMYPVFGIRGASWVLGMSEWSFAVLLFLGFWHKRLGVLGALGSCAAFRHDHPVHARRLGPIGGWVSGHGGQRAVSHEGRRPFRGVGLPAQAGRRTSVSVGAAE